MLFEYRMSLLPGQATAWICGTIFIVWLAAVGIIAAL
jgi:hypothetical protein